LGTKTYVALLLMALFGVACGSSSTPAAATSHAAAPTSDAVTQTYVALVKGYWDGIVAADGVSGNFNEASLACLGTINGSAPPRVDLVEPANCRPHAIALLAVHDKFLGDLKGAIAPEQFGDDDKIFRSQVPRAVVAMKALILATATGKKQAVFDASQAYVDIMLGSVVGAMDDVDPATRHY